MVAYRNGVSGTDQPIEDAKSAMRRRLIQTRRDRPDPLRQAARGAITRHVIRALSGYHRVAAYLPLPSEPLDLSAVDLLATRARVLVPVVTGAAPMDWCDHPGPVRRGAFGIDEPAGPRLGIQAIAAVDAVLVPALAVDSRGRRLGRGGGHYDRTLALLATLLGSAPLPPRIALVYDDELLDELPADDLDQPVSAAITPSGGLVNLG